MDNENGTAPGLILPYLDKHILLLPGPPEELEPMFVNQMSPYLKELQQEVICSSTVKLCGIGESKAETQILDLLEKQSNPTIAPYAKTGEVHFRVTARAETEAKAKALLEPVVQELTGRFGSQVYTIREEVSLEQAVAELLQEKGC